MHLWVPYSDSYILELLGADGRVHQRLERRVLWFPAVSRGDAGNRLGPRIHDVMVGADGLLWILIRRRHRDWKPPDTPGPDRLPAPVDPRRLGALDLDKTFEGVIEVLDPRDSTLVASVEVGGGVLGFPAPGLLYGVQQDDLGRVSMRIWRLALTFK